MPAVAETSGTPQAAMTSWPWWVWPLRPAPKRDAAPPKVCVPRTGNTPGAAPGATGTGAAAWTASLRPGERRRGSRAEKLPVIGLARHAHAEAVEALVADAGAQVVGAAAAALQHGVAHRAQAQPAHQHQAAAPDLAARARTGRCSATSRRRARARSAAAGRSRPCRHGCPARSRRRRPPTGPAPGPRSRTSGPHGRAGRGCRRGHRGRRPCRRCPARCPTPAAGCRRGAGRRRRRRCTPPT